VYIREFHGWDQDKSVSDLMTNLEGKIEKTIGNTYGLRTWIEYGLKHAKK
jgi:hypothetical protein